jgi:hypothetical protein
MESNALKASVDDFRECPSGRVGKGEFSSGSFPTSDLGLEGESLDEAMEAVRADEFELDRCFAFCFASACAFF